MPKSKRAARLEQDDALNASVSAPGPVDVDDEEDEQPIAPKASGFAALAASEEPEDESESDEPAATPSKVCARVVRKV